MKRVNVYLKEEVYESLRKDAFERKMSMSAYIASKLGNPMWIVSHKGVDVESIIAEPGKIIVADNPDKIAQFVQNPKLPKPQKKGRVVNKPITRAFNGLVRGELDVENYV